MTLFRRLPSKNSRVARFCVAVAALGACFCSVPVALADATVSGYISNVTFAGNDVLIIASGGVPSNCNGTPYGWMRIAPESKAMSAFVLGLWLRGDVSSTSMTIYSNGIDSSGFCTITQIDPDG